MGHLGDKNLVYDRKVSSVVPARVTGENIVHELSNMDLVMKLHYLKGLYYFKNHAVQGLTIHDFKTPMFHWLEKYYVASGRIRKSDSGRPLIKCNDSGVRIVEAQCNMTLEEVLDNKDFSIQNQLVPDQVLGPDLAFSPLVFIQFTWFKCGGICVGLSWAHALGDVFSASSFINLWGKLMAANLPPKSLNLPNARTKTGRTETLHSFSAQPLSVKSVELSKDSWITGNNCRMETLSFQIGDATLKKLQSDISSQNQTGRVPPFEALCAIIWQCVAKIREGKEPRIVTTCRNNIHNREDGILGNNQIVSVVKADFAVAEADPSELAALLVKRSKDETRLIEDTMEGDQGQSNFILYGANLTFVDLEGAGLYGLELKGERPTFANYTADGVGSEGVVLVLPGPENTIEIGACGRTVTAIFPENQVMELREKLRTEWGII